MAESGAMCSLLNFEAVRAMGLDPEKLEKSHVSISGVNGRKLVSQHAKYASRLSTIKLGLNPGRKFMSVPKSKRHFCQRTAW